MKDDVGRENQRPAPNTTRESRGPETSRYLEDDTFSTRVDKKGRRGRQNAPVKDEFDDDLVR